MNEDKNWPEDTDGDVFRILEERQFDFNTPHEIEFPIDFNTWPLNKAQQEQAIKRLPEAKFIQLDESEYEDNENSGYLSYIVKEKVTYDFVIKEQKRLSSLFNDINGY